MLAGIDTNQTLDQLGLPPLPPLPAPASSNGGTDLLTNILNGVTGIAGQIPAITNGVTNLTTAALGPTNTAITTVGTQVDSGLNLVFVGLAILILILLVKK